MHSVLTEEPKASDLGLCGSRARKDQKVLGQREARSLHLPFGMLVLSASGQDAVSPALAGTRGPSRATCAWETVTGFCHRVKQQLPAWPACRCCEDLYLFALKCVTQAWAMGGCCPLGQRGILRSVPCAEASSAWYPWCVRSPPWSLQGLQSVLGQVS